MLDNRPLPDKIAQACTGHEYEETLDALLQIFLELLQMTEAGSSRNQLILIHAALILSTAKGRDVLEAQLAPVLHLISDIADANDRDAEILNCIRALVLLSSVFGGEESKGAEGLPLYN